jgi:hypothetical protein
VCARVLVYSHSISSGLSGIIALLEADEFPFFLDPLEGTETSDVVYREVDARKVTPLPR